MSQEKKNSVLETNSLSRKIISKLLVTVAVMLFLIVVVSAVISMISKLEVQRINWCQLPMRMPF